MPKWELFRKFPFWRFKLSTLCRQLVLPPAGEGGSRRIPGGAAGDLISVYCRGGYQPPADECENPAKRAAEGVGPYAETAVPVVGAAALGGPQREALSLRASDRRHWRGNPSLKSRRQSFLSAVGEGLAPSRQRSVLS